MTWQSWAYIGIFLAWAAVEATGIAQGDKPGALRTLSANLRFLVRPTGPRWHALARWGFVLFLAWFGPHILNG